MTTWAIAAASIAYVGLLFATAWWADRHSQAVARSPWRPYIYAVSLAVYCTSWTFFGAVGTAASQGWNYLPIYIGPALLFLFGHRALARLIAAAKRENITSIADFISSRYGKSQSVAALVTILALTGVLPYIALQLKSITSSFEALRQGFQAEPDMAVDRYALGLLSALVLAGFSIMFGARRYDATGRNQGMVVAIALESVVKIMALMAIAILALVVMVDVDPGRLGEGRDRFASLFSPQSLTPRFLTLTFLSAVAIICLPRQFHIGVVECLRPEDANTARWLFPFYMLITILVVIPITLAGLAVLPQDSSPDLFVIDLPLSLGSGSLALLAFLGGISAATGMVIVETVALSTMISNHLLAPILLRRRANGQKGAGDFGRLLLSVRRMTIVAVMLLAYLCYRNLGAGELLASIGLISFAAVAQFAPPLVGAVAWQRGNSAGARAGLIGGMALWFYTLLLPFMAGNEAIAAAGLNTALGGFIRPDALLGLSGLDTLTHGVIWSIGVNTLLYVLFSLGTPLHLKDRLHALSFVTGGGARQLAPATSVGDLLALAERFAGREAVEREAHPVAAVHRRSSPRTIDRNTARAMEVLIAGVMAPTAR
jgi:Na+/proline symporter